MPFGSHSGLSHDRRGVVAALGAGCRAICSVIAEILMLERTTVSTLVAKLARKGLVSYGVGVDRRHKAISLTEKGEVSAALVTGKLGRVTAELYAGVDASLKSKTNELHMRMYATYSRA